MDSVAAVVAVADGMTSATMAAAAVVVNSTSAFTQRTSCFGKASFFCSRDCKAWGVCGPAEASDGEH